MNKPYVLSFTVGSLFWHESIKATELFHEYGDWSLVKARLLGDNILQIKKESSKRKIVTSLINRLELLKAEEISFFSSSSDRDQKYLLWIAICRQYSFIHDFALEVLHNRFILLEKKLEYKHFDEFIESKAFWHPELEEIISSTRKKLRQVLFRMMREAGVLSDENQIIQAIPSRGLADLISRDKFQELLLLPVFENDLKRGV